MSQTVEQERLSGPGSGIGGTVGVVEDAADVVEIGVSVLPKSVTTPFTSDSLSVPESPVVVTFPTGFPEPSVWV